MKRLLILIIFLVSSIYSFPQAFRKGNSIISAGYGFPNFNKKILSAFESLGNYKTTGVGPIHSKYEFAITDKHGIGVSISFASWKATWTRTYEDYDPNTNTYTEQAFEESTSGTSTAISARYNLHFGTTEKFDAYWGIGFGYKINRYSYYSGYAQAQYNATPNYAPLSFETTIGFRYYFTPFMGFYSEFGIAKSLIQGGTVFKF